MAPGCRQNGGKAANVGNMGQKGKIVDKRGKV